MSQPILGPLPPPLDGKAMNLFPAARGAKDLMRATSQYTWQRRKQDLERHSAFRLQGQRSLSKLHAKPPEGRIPAELYDPSLLPRYVCPGSFEEDPFLEPMVRRVKDMKKLCTNLESFSPRLAEWEVAKGSPPDVQEWISKTLASAPKLAEPEAKGVDQKPRPKKSRRRRSSSEKDKATIRELTEDAGFLGEDWGELSDASAYLQKIKTGVVLSDEEVQRIHRIFQHLSPDNQFIKKDAVYKALQDFGVAEPDRGLLSNITNEVAPYSQVDLRDLVEITEKWRSAERDDMEETFQSMCGGKLAVEDLFRCLVAIGMTPLRGRVEDVLELVDPKQTGELDFEQVVQLVLLYRHTEGFSLKEVKVLRGICAREARGQKGLPRFKLKDVFLLFFGIHQPELTEQISNEALAGATDRQGQMTLSEILLWARRHREMEFKAFRLKFHAIDADRSGRVEFSELSRLVGHLGITVQKATIQELVEDSSDSYLGLGRKDGALDYHEFVNFMLKLRTREGFSVAEVKQFKEVFDRFDDNNNSEVEVLELADMFRYLGRSVKLDELQVVISQVDFNGSGALEFQEFLRLMRIHREEEVNRIRHVFKRYADGAALPKASLQSAMTALGFSGEAVSLAKMRAKVSGRRNSLQKQATLRLEDAGDTISFEQFLQWVDDISAVKVNEQRRCAGFTSTELDAFRIKFAEFDLHSTGLLDAKHIGPLLEQIGLSCLASSEERNQLLADIEKAREKAVSVGVQDVGAKGEGLNFWGLVQLLRIQFSRSESKVLERETRAVEETAFFQGEVDSFRESFVSWFEQQARRASSNGEEQEEKRTKELNKDTVFSLVRSLGVSVNEEQRKRLDRKIEELNPNLQLDFPDFLRLMRWMVMVDFGGINRI